jgi:hypothetical protein
LHGEQEIMDRRGLYRNDTLFIAAAFRDTDVVTLLFGLPLLAIAYLRFRRGSLCGGLLLAGVLSYFLYLGASLTFSAAFNRLFLVYVALFSASLFAFIRAMTLVDLQALPAHVTPSMPHRALGIFMFIAGLGSFFIWLSELIPPLLFGQVPELLGPYTTFYTYGFDSAVITPAAVLAGVYLLQRRPLGYLIAVPLLILLTLIGVVVIAQTVAQYLAGIIFPIGVYVGLIGSWVLLGGFAIWLAIRFFLSISEEPVN